MRLYLIVVLCVLLIGCTQSISELKDEKMVGERVTAVGIAKSPIKVGSLSGFTLEDQSGSIGVRSDELPAEGDKVTVSGVVIRDSIFGYYIQAKSVN